MSALIHIGLYKTASTFLQKNIFTNIQNRDYIQNVDPGLCKQIKHLARQEAINHMNTGMVDSKALIEIKKSVKEHNRDLIISSESFAGHPGLLFKDYRRIALTLNKIFPEGKILLVIREQSSYLESLYKHAVKKGSTMSIDDFLNIKQNRDFINTNIQNFNFKLKSPTDYRCLNYLPMVGLQLIFLRYKMLLIMLIGIFSSFSSKYS